MARNLPRVRRQIGEAALRAERDPRQIILVAVTKAFQPDTIRRAYELGILDFGENRVQEAEDKILQLRQELKVTWHMIGPLQRNKVKKALELFDWIHSVESFALAAEISKRAGQAGKEVPILLEINTAGQSHKHGYSVPPDASSESRARFFDETARILDLPNLLVEGLMTMAPPVAQAEEARPYFRHLRALRDELRARFPDRDWRHLSMGMTDDFPVAIEEGATLVRIGRAIFGERRDHD
ncbi:MAG: YggS family pyridoxal phosphate-dependent enzyme [Chloroflexi bacterium]|nr:YggS family pyridoxal phosphate-dependent enzyme [Chloroflexota bacterium]